MAIPTVSTYHCVFIVLVYVAGYQGAGEESRLGTGVYRWRQRELHTLQVKSPFKRKRIQSCHRRDIFVFDSQLPYMALLHSRRMCEIQSIAFKDDTTDC